MLISEQSPEWCPSIPQDKLATKAASSITACYIISVNNCCKNHPVNPHFSATFAQFVHPTQPSLKLRLASQPLPEGINKKNARQTITRCIIIS
jgi:hypothetical protein